MPIAQRDSEVELAAMNGDLARRGTCLCLVWAHPHPYPLIIIIIIITTIILTKILILMLSQMLHSAWEWPYFAPTCAIRVGVNCADCEFA